MVKSSVLHFHAEAYIIGGKEAVNTQIIVINGPLSEREQDIYIRHVTAKHPMSEIEKLYLEVQGEYVDIHYTLYRRRELRKMSGYCVSEPALWNQAKQAELRDTVPNAIGEEPR